MLCLIVACGLVWSLVWTNRKTPGNDTDVSVVGHEAVEEHCGVFAVAHTPGSKICTETGRVRYAAERKHQLVCTGKIF